MVELMTDALRDFIRLCAVVGIATFCLQAAWNEYRR